MATLIAIAMLFTLPVLMLAAALWRFALATERAAKVHDEPSWEQTWDRFSSRSPMPTVRDRLDGIEGFSP